MAPTEITESATVQASSVSVALLSNKAGLKTATWLLYSLRFRLRSLHNTQYSTSIICWGECERARTSCPDVAIHLCERSELSGWMKAVLSRYVDR